MRPWINVSFKRVLIISALSLVVISCARDEQKQETVQAPLEDEATRLMRSVLEIDLDSSPELAALNCRRISKALDVQHFSEDLRAKCAQAMLIMAGRAALGQPVMIRKSPEEWMNDATSFGASEQSISRTKKQIVADKKDAEAEEKRQKAEAKKTLREMGSANRIAIAERLRTNFLDSGLDIKVKTSGRHAERVTFEYVLFNDVWSHRFQKDGVLSQLRDAGFGRVDMTDGYNWHVYWTF